LNQIECEYFNNGECRSCGLINQNYQQGLESKFLQLKQLFNQQAIENIVPSPILNGYRHKAKMVVSGSLDHPVIGIPSEAQGAQSTNILHCPIHAPLINQILQDLPALLKKFKISPYDVKKRKGELKFIILSQAFKTNEVMLQFTLRSKESLERLIKINADLIKKYPHIKVITASIQPIHKAIIQGDEELILSDNQAISSQLGNTFLTIGPQTFFQINPSVAELLYTRVAQELLHLEVKQLIDLYCGAGAFSLFAASVGIESKGLEISSNAIELANQAVKINGLKNCQYMIADCDKLDLSQIAPHGPDKMAIIVNPPRRGLSPYLTERIIQQRPPILIYSSCNPATLARDLQILREHYKIIKMIPFDMFPYTQHLEVLCIMSIG